MSSQHVKSEPYMMELSRANETKKTFDHIVIKKLQNSVAESSFQEEEINLGVLRDDKAL